MTSRTLSYSAPEDSTDSQTEDVATNANLDRCGSAEVDQPPPSSAPEAEDRPSPLSPIAALQPPARELRSHSRALSSTAVTPT